MIDSGHSRTPDLFLTPVAAKLSSSEHILLAGAGGGFDVFAALPLFLSLRRAGKQVHLANLSFTYLAGTTSERLGETSGA